MSTSAVTAAVSSDAREDQQRRAQAAGAGDGGSDSDAIAAAERQRHLPDAQRDARARSARTSP